jgi:adenylate kinase family enzyme
MQRIVVVGTSGSGKTTLARVLADRLNLNHVELDALHWGPNWTPTPTDALRPRVIEALAGDRWSVCGNYRTVRDVTWERADTLVWLDYAMRVPLYRVLRRTLRRCWRREVLWAGNRERMFVQLFTRDSIFLWVLTSWRKNRLAYPKLLPEQARLGKTIHRFRSPAETEGWLASVGPR